MTIDLLTASGVLLLAIVFSGLLVGVTLRLVREYGGLSQVRPDVPATHQEKQGTPTMGGIGLVAALALVGFLAAGVIGQGSGPMILVVCCAVLFSLVGFADDYAKLLAPGGHGILARYRILIELALGLLFTWLLATISGPVEKPTMMGFAGLPLGMRVALGGLVIAFSANAVNMTDGLDGLAGGTSALAALALAAVCWIAGLPHLALIALVIAGVATGFLWYNRKPAAIWMGDVGSLALGAGLAAVAVAGGLELIFAVIGIIFIIEAASVVMQVTYFKLTGGRRIFPMTPLHHSFELAGWPETVIVTRFWIAAAVVGLLGILLAAAAMGPQL